MTEEYLPGAGVEWTALKAWLHPRRAVYALDNLLIMETTLRRQLEEALQAMSQIEAQAREAGEREAAVRGQLGEARRETAALREQLAEEKAARMEQEEVMALIGEFDKRLTQAEVMKRDYERRIADLESRLADARLQLGRLGASDLLEPEGDGGPTAPDGRRPTRFTAGADRNEGPRAPGPEHRPDDDWLLDLPEEL